MYVYNLFGKGKNSLINNDSETLLKVSALEEKKKTNQKKIVCFKLPCLAI